jgi:pyruvate formate lyase activating enzyme
VQGLVSRIQRFSTGDGPGIRSTVFLKGCNLACAWCHNPELMARENELRFTESNCADCRTCVRVCPNGAWYVNGARAFDPSRCEVCGTCAASCSYDAVGTVARWTEAAEVVDTLLRDRAYYRNSGGGITVSGGEPLLQPSFVREVFAGARAAGVHTALDTAGCVAWRHFEELLDMTDLVLLDVKSMDSEVHRRWTGVPNELILENARRLARADVDVIVRIPVVPTVNDDAENLRRTAELLSGFPRLRGVELIPYHELGVDKVHVLPPMPLHVAAGESAPGGEARRPGEQRRFRTPNRTELLAHAAPFVARGLPVLSPTGAPAQGATRDPS